MKKALAFIFLLTLLVACNSVTPTLKSPAQAQWWHKPHTPSLLIPFYSDPGDANFQEYQRLVKLQLEHPRLWMVVILNVDFDGPDWVGDTNNYRTQLKTAVQALVESGVEVVGYVDTSYTLRPYQAAVEGTPFQSNIQTNIQHWVNNFPEITGIFVDQMCYQPRIYQDPALDDPAYNCLVPHALSQAPERDSESPQAYKDVVAYYRNIYKYARRDQGLRWVITNPGRETPLEFFEENVGDNIVTYEGSEAALDPQAAQFTSHNPDPQTVSVLVYAASFDRAKLEGLVGKVDQIYLTDDSMPNPWDTLPPYLEDLANALDP